MYDFALILVEKHSLREENDSLKCQVEAFKNEIMMVKHENQTSTTAKDNQLKMLQQAMQGMQQVSYNLNLDLLKTQAVGRFSLCH